MPSHLVYGGRAGPYGGRMGVIDCLTQSTCAGAVEKLRWMCRGRTAAAIFWLHFTCRIGGCRHIIRCYYAMLTLITAAIRWPYGGRSSDNSKSLCGDRRKVTEAVPWPYDGHNNLAKYGFVFFLTERALIHGFVLIYFYIASAARPPHDHRNFYAAPAHTLRVNRLTVAVRPP